MMELINGKVKVLSNFEVYSLLQELCGSSEKDKRKLAKSQVHLANIAFDTIRYFEKTPCKYQSAEIITAFLEAVKHFKITKAEKLQMINLRPTTPVEMQLIIEDSEERMTEEEVEILIQLIKQYLPEQVTESDFSNSY